MKPQKFFTTKEIAFIKKNAEILSYNEIAKKLNRSSSSIRNKMRHMRDHGEFGKPVNTKKKAGTDFESWFKSLLPEDYSYSEKKAKDALNPPKKPSCVKPVKKENATFTELYKLLSEIYTELEKCWHSVIETLPDKKTRDLLKKIPRNEKEMRELFEKAFSS